MTSRANSYCYVVNKGLGFEIIAKLNNSAFDLVGNDIKLDQLNKVQFLFKVPIIFSNLNICEFLSWYRHSVLCTFAPAGTFGCVYVSFHASSEQPCMLPAAGCGGRTLQRVTYAPLERVPIELPGAASAHFIRQRMTNCVIKDYFLISALRSDRRAVEMLVTFSKVKKVEFLINLRKNYRS